MIDQLTDRRRSQPSDRYRTAVAVTPTTSCSPSRYTGSVPGMKVITQREFRNNSAAVMDAVEAGETYYVTRNGVEVAELRPLRRGRRLTAEQLVERHRRLPRVDGAALRSEADAVFGSDDLIDDNDAVWRGR